MSKEIWLWANDPDDEINMIVLDDAARDGIDSVIVPDGTEVEGFKNILYSSDVRLITINSSKDLMKAKEMMGSFKMVILALNDWIVIPIENLLAESKGTKIVTMVSSAEQAKLHLSILERGVDGVVVDSVDVCDLEDIRTILKEHHDEKFAVAEVRSVKDVGIGDRVCVDTLMMMSSNEGMLVGSQSSCLFLILSENDENGYIETRPFRVNAGAVHSYILAPEGKTRYLSELRSGDPILVVNDDGSTYSSSVGRCKIERRPMLMVEASLNGKRYSVILQNAETVRLIGPGGAIPVTSLVPGDKVFVRPDDTGRHCGTAVDETVREV